MGTTSPSGINLDIESGCDNQRTDFGATVAKVNVDRRRERCTFCGT